MRWKTWVIALLALGCGVGLWLVGEKNPEMARVERTLGEWMAGSHRQDRPRPVRVTLIDMEDAENWTALEYALFLKALPRKNPPVVIFESLPPSRNTAFDRAFNELAMKQPRLVLPVRLAWAADDDEASHWWLKGWKAHSATTAGSLYGSVQDGLPEALRGTVAVGISNVVTTRNRAPLYFQIGKKEVPSQALRAAMLLRKKSDADVRFDSGLLLDGQRFWLDPEGTLPVDTALVGKLRKIAASDLLLPFGAVDAIGTAPSGRDQLEGVLVLGDFSKKARSLYLENGQRLTPAEWIAATVAAICNAPPLTAVATSVRIAIFVTAAAATFFFATARRSNRSFALAAIFGVYLLFAAWLSARYSLALPLVSTFCILLSGALLHSIPSNSAPETHGTE